MIMELPDKPFRMQYAEVINGELLIYENVRRDACQKQLALWIMAFQELQVV